MGLLEKYSFGIGDRFGMQGEAQLKALQMAVNAGISVVPVWNKSNREHQIIHSRPENTRIEADNAVKNLNWKNNYYVDADHINLKNVDGFIEYCDFFTIDVADFIGKEAKPEDINYFTEENKKYAKGLVIPGIKETFTITEDNLKMIGSRFLLAVQEAGRIYQYIRSKKGTGNFITEVSMDEVDEAQSPVEMFFILSMLGKSGIPVQTIAPKFTGRFNKGVDYVGDLNRFAMEFEQDLLVIDAAVKEFNLPSNLKLSVHSGSDKFSIYPVMGRLIRKHDKGIHIKTAGTTWLEEITGLALAGGEALELAKSVYAAAWERRDELCKPYATVIDIDESRLPPPSGVKNWNARKFASSLQHIPGHKDFNPDFRQLLHVGYKIAAEFDQIYYNMVRKYSEIIGQQVTTNIFDRHLRRLFEL